MEYLITSVVFGLCFFICPLWAYRRGLNDGLRINQGKSIDPIRSPVQAVKTMYREVKEKESEDKFIQGLQNMMTYDGTPQKVGDKE